MILKNYGHYLLYLVFFSLAFHHYPEVHIGIAYLSITDILIYGSVLYYVFNIKIYYRALPIILFLFSCVCLIILSSFLSGEIDPRGTVKLFSYLKTCISFSIITLLIIRLDNFSKIENILIFIILGGLIGMISYWNEYIFIGQYYKAETMYDFWNTKNAGLFTTNYAVGEFALIMTSFIFYLLINKKSWLLKFILLATLIISIGATIGSFSRGGQLSLFFTIITFIIMYIFFSNLSLYRKIIFSTATLLIFVILLLIINYLGIFKIDIIVNRLLTLIRPTENYEYSMGMRLQIFINGWEMIKDNLLVGVGPQQFQHYVLDYGITDRLFKPRDAHNTFLKVFAEHGIFSFIFYLTLILHILFKSLKDFLQSRKNKNEKLKLFYLSFISLNIGLIFLSLTVDRIFYQHVFLIYALYYGVTLNRAFKFNS